jgi:DNA gyrase subunit A
MEVGIVRSIDIDREMQQAYLDYAMSVIVARALPDARDGLKPVHRRILYAMYDMGLRPDTPYKKSARVVGEVLGKYHPHGDVAVYEAMARMAQDFSMRYLLVDGQGNFGSVDGDPPAAMRYTEARLTAPAMHMLADIQRNTVDFSDNFDGTLQEPDVLPSSLPNLLVNGATGIAVGMSTSIPPHNLGEVVDALKYMLERWDNLDDINVEDLMRFIKGPDFPTGGVILPSTGEEGLTSAYGSGRGRVVVQARAHIEEMDRGRNRIIVTQLPYMTNKSSLIERIAELAREERLEGIADLRDESDRHGLRIVIEVNKTADPQAVLQVLYKSTPMRSTFGIIMLALVDGEPRLLSLKQALRVYLDHRLAVIRRRSEYDLEKARQRAHILEGLRIALQNLDEVIALIRKAPDVETARARLIKRFKLSDVQAQAILDMPLRRLAALERKKIEEEYKEVQAQIKDLVSLLRTPKRMREVVATELQAVKDAYGDRRKTQIIQRGGEASSALPIVASDFAPEHTVWISVTREGQVSRTLDEEQPRTSGREAPLLLVKVNTRDILYLVNSRGDAAGIPVHSVPETASPSEGTPFFKISALAEGDELTSLFTLPAREDRPEGWYVFTTTRQGMVKKSSLAELPGLTARSFPLVKVNEGDRLGWVRLTDGKADVFLATADGMAIRFSEEEVRPMGMVAAGVGGIKLQGRDEVIGMEILPDPGEILFLASDGKAKRVEASQFPTQGRYGMGVQAWKLPRTEQLVGIAPVAPGKPRKGARQINPGGASALQSVDRITLHLDKLAPKALRVDEAPMQARSALGKLVVELKAGDRLAAVTAPWSIPRLISGEVDEVSPTPPVGGKKGRDISAQDAVKKSQPALFEEKPSSNGATDKKPASNRRKASSGQTMPGDIEQPKVHSSRSPAKTPAKKSQPGKGKTTGKGVTPGHRGSPAKQKTDSASKKPRTSKAPGDSEEQNLPPKRNSKNTSSGSKSAAKDSKLSDDKIQNGAKKPGSRRSSKKG